MKTIKKISFIICIVFFVIKLNNSVYASVVHNGTCGSSLTWELDDQGTLFINGTGDMNDYATNLINSYHVTKAPWGIYREDIYSLNINSGITSIGDRAFSGCTNIQGDLVIPNTVTEIGDGAFYQCTGLNGNLVLSNNLTRIGGEAFYNTRFIGTINIPNSVDYIGSAAFESSSNFDTLIISSNLHILYMLTFAGCDSLKNITFSDNLETIERDTFGICNSLEEVTIPSSVTFIGNDNTPFYRCQNLVKLTNNSNVSCILPEIDGFFWYREGDKNKEPILEIQNGVAIRTKRIEIENKKEEKKEEEKETKESQILQDLKSELPYGIIMCGNGGKGNNGKDAIGIKVLKPEQRDTTNQEIFAKAYFKNKNISTMFSYNFYPPYGSNASYKNAVKTIYWNNTGLKYGDEVYAIWYCQSSKQGIQVIKCDIDSNGLVSIRIPQLGETSVITLVKVNK